MAARIACPLVAAVVGALVVAAVTLEVRRGTKNGATVLAVVWGRTEPV